MEEQSVYIWSGGDIIISNEHVCGFLPPTPHHHHHSTLKQIKIFSCREIFIVFLFLCQRSNFPKLIFLRKYFCFFPKIFYLLFCLYLLGVPSQ